MVAVVCGVLAVPTLGAAPAAHAQNAIEYALIVAALANTGGFNDTTPPAITLTTPADGATYAPGQQVTADYACTDAGVTAMNAVATATGQTLDALLAIFAEHGADLGHPACDGPVPSGAAIDTSPGAHAFTLTARDLAFTIAPDSNGDGAPDVIPQPNTATVTTHYTVAYAFNGFRAPVANPPGVNPVKAGQAVPIKFSLGGDRGLGILPSTPTSGPTDCTHGPAGAPLPAVPAGAPVSAVPAGNRGLQYDAASDTYTWVWKTDSAWKGTCRTLTVALDDGITHAAYFAFK
ncbi:MAG TPA: PxKF domain-containing protein [Solirubrobacteraceae bacterium]|nr:PxKF domain-containing protein [Solirubrobacteraceae bacterium]